MKIKLAIAGLALAIAAVAAGTASVLAQQSGYVTLGWISEEQPAARCPSGFALSSLRCRGGWCDDIQPTCRRYALSPNSVSQQPRYWTDWFSEERTAEVQDGYNFPRLSDQYAVAVGIQCRNRRCDDLRLEMLPMRGSGGPAIDFVPTLDSKAENPICAFSAGFSEETSSPPQPPADVGQSMNLIRRVGCSGGWCDNLKIEWCRVFLRPPLTRRQK
jgi:hypothetical protein